MTSAVPGPEGGTPWYRNFWPWFIVGLLGTSVAGSLLTVAIAYRHRDVDVRFAVDPEASPDALRVEGGAGP
jgi:hypothetical protein